MSTLNSSSGSPSFLERGPGGEVHALSWLLLFLLFALPARAQQLLGYQYTDSLTQTLLTQQRYHALDSVGRAALAQGAGYPALRRRLGASALATGHPAAALRYYGPALHQNPLDDEARVGLASAYLGLNQTGPAALLAGALAPETRRALGLPQSRAVAQLEVETLVQTTAERRRGTGTYQRLALGSRLGPRLGLRQSLSYFNQAVELPVPGRRGAVESHRISQGQYQALLTAQLAPRWQVKAGYDYITKDLGSNHLGYLALAYARPVWVAQAGMYAGVVTDTARVQLDLRLTVYPLGNLNLYGFGRGSVVRSGGRAHPNGLLGAGGRLRPWLWAEAWGSAGTVPVLAEVDGTYVYNLLDPLGRRAAASLLILAPQRLRLRLAYSTEQRHIVLINSVYTLHSYSATLAWNW